MNSTDRIALHQFAEDLFNARAALVHERQCIDRARSLLKGTIDIYSMEIPESEKVRRLAGLIDLVTKELERRYEPST